MGALREPNNQIVARIAHLVNNFLPRFFERLTKCYKIRPVRTKSICETISIKCRLRQRVSKVFVSLFLGSNK